MSGFFSKIIRSLLGEGEEKPVEKREKLNEVKASLSSRAPSRANAESDADAAPKSNIRALILRAYGRAAAAISEKGKNRHTVALTGIVLAVLITLLSYTSLFFYMQGAILAIILIFVAALSKLIQKLFPFVVGFDLCLFFTVLFSIAYHPFAGITVGVFSSAIGSIARGQYDADKVLVPLLGYITVGLLLLAFPATNIFYAGMAMALAYSIMMSIIFWFIMQSVFNTITFLITSIAFNYWLFSSYSGYFLMLMGFNG